MIEQSAIIIAIETPPTEGSAMATIEVVRKTACGLCGQTSGCGNAFWGKLFAHKSSSFKAQNTINAQVGQTVVVGIDETAVMKSALILYLLPLVTMFAGALLAVQIVNADASAILGALLGLLLGFFWLKAHVAGRVYYQNHLPKILRLENNPSAEQAVQFQ
ncbi:MAG: SoxR reducing system RseC family protein [Methylophilaceae bacterium]|nr:SoxR reducing system RseC family protein [Methylophilaceae bacterium]